MMAGVAASATGVMAGVVTTVPGVIVGLAAFFF